MDEKEKFNIKDGLSINEAKVSTLIILCVLTFLYAFVMYVIDKDITDNLSDKKQEDISLAIDETSTKNTFDNYERDVVNNETIYS